MHGDTANRRISPSYKHGWLGFEPFFTDESSLEPPVEIVRGKPGNLHAAQQEFCPAVNWAGARQDAQQLSLGQAEELGRTLLGHAPFGDDGGKLLWCHGVNHH